MNAIIENDEVDFSDLDDLDNAQTSKSSKPEYKETCMRCGGTGKYRGISRFGRDCFQCKGKGVLIFKSKPEQRAKNRAKAAKKRAELQQAKIEAKLKKIDQFKSDHANAYDWMLRNKSWSSFAQSLYNNLNQWGSLTESQISAIYKSIEKESEKKAEQVKNAADVGGAGFDNLLKGFASAKSSGLKRPKLIVDKITFSLAPEHGKNAGFVYVKVNGEYCGKINPDGKFFKSYTCNDSDVELIAKVGKDPLAEAIAHGKRTGNCSCCGRPLTNKLSVELGIGPICRDKWGW